MVASQSRHQKGTMNRVLESFQGTKGTVLTGADLAQQATLKDYKGKVLYQHGGEDDANPYQVEHNELFASIRSGGVIFDIDNAVNSTLAAIMGRMATYSGKVVTREQALAADDAMVPVETGLSWDSKPPVVPDDQGQYPVPKPGEYAISKTKTA